MSYIKHSDELHISGQLAGELINRVQFLTRLVMNTFSSSEQFTEEREGGYFCYADGISGYPLLLIPVGFTRDNSKTPKSLCFSQEKALRLAFAPDHLSSWQSRDETQEKFGGAIRNSKKTRIYSYSGLPEEWDQAIMLNLSHYFGDIVNEDVEEILSISGLKARTVFIKLREILKNLGK